jgi:16S rRNA (guanine527-N7)-methyltransferase
MTPVSRETSRVPLATAVELPPVPAAAAEVFGDRLPAAEEFARLLGTDGVARGLLGPREVPRLWDRHLLNCAVVAQLLPAGATVRDVGSGAGLPGIALALARPDLRVTLLEPLQRRVAFLAEVVPALDLQQVQVVRGRAGDPSPGRDGAVPTRVDIVTARAVAPLARLAGWCLPLLRPGGSLIALKGRQASAELSAARDDLRRLGAGDATIEICGQGWVDPPTTVVRIVLATEQSRASRRGDLRRKGQR